MATYSTVNAIPKMTSNTTPSGKAYASQFRSGQYDAWYAFDHLANDGWLLSDRVSTGWLAYQFPSPKVIYKYSITARNGVKGDAKDWTFEGSNDGAIWDILDLRTNEINWAVKEKRSYEISNKKYYTHYRINVSSISGTGSYLAIGEFEMFEIVYYDKFLILFNGDNHTIVNERITDNIVTNMTSNTAPSSRAFSSSGGAGTEAYRAFNGNPTSGYWRSSNTSFPHFIGYEFDTKKTITRYNLYTSLNTSGRTPSTWTFEGSDDGVEWDLLDKRQNEIFAIGSKNSYNLQNEKQYKMYRLLITKTVSGEQFTELTLFEMFETIQGQLISIPSSEKYIVNYGMEKGEEVDLSGTIKFKTYVEEGSSVLGVGKVFKKSIDTSKTPINTVSII